MDAQKHSQLLRERVGKNGKYELKFMRMESGDYLCNCNGMWKGCNDLEGDDCYIGRELKPDSEELSNPKKCNGITKSWELSKLDEPKLIAFEAQSKR